MSAPLDPPTVRNRYTPTVDTTPPRRGKVTGGLAALACAACCALPLLIAAGVLTGGPRALPPGWVIA